MLEIRGQIIKDEFNNEIKCQQKQIDSKIKWLYFEEIHTTKSSELIDNNNNIFQQPRPSHK